MSLCTNIHQDRDASESPPLPGSMIALLYTHRQYTDSIPVYFYTCTLTYLYTYILYLYTYIPVYFYTCKLKYLYTYILHTYITVYFYTCILIDLNTCRLNTPAHIHVCLWGVLVSDFRLISSSVVSAFSSLLHFPPPSLCIFLSFFYSYLSFSFSSSISLHPSQLGGRSDSDSEHRCIL